MNSIKVATIFLLVWLGSSFASPIEGLQHANLQLRVIGISEDTGITFYSSFDEQTGMDFVAAMEFCRTNGAFPARITTREDAELVANAVGNVPNPPFWHSLNELGREGVFRFLKGGASPTFVHWIPNHPFLNDHSKNCIAVYPWYNASGLVGSWINTECSGLYRPLCDSSP